jgi:vancomycin resistance protein VanJ
LIIALNYQIKINRKRTWIGTIWSYCGFVVGWYILHLLYGDSIWWLGLLNAIAPWLFAPLLLLLPVTLVTIGTRHYVPLLYGPLLAPIILFLALYGSLFAPVRTTARAASDPSLTVLSFNIWAGSRSEATIEVIAANGWPDIVAIQELTPPMAELILEKVGSHYPYHLLDITPYHYGLGIFSRFPLTMLDSSAFADSALRVQIATVYPTQAMQQPFTFYNLHLSFGDVLYDLGHGAVVRDKIATGYQTRLELTRKLVQDVQNRVGPVLVAGDFNSTPQSDVYATMSTYLTDAYRAAGWGFGFSYPTHAADIPRVSYLPRIFRIDMIFFSAGFRAARSWTSSAYGESDHLPVVTRLLWTN